MQVSLAGHASLDDSVSSNLARAASPGIASAATSPLPTIELQPQLRVQNRAKLRTFLSEVQSASLDGSSSEGGSVGGTAVPASNALSPKAHSRASPSAQHRISDVVSAARSDSEDDGISRQVTLFVTLTEHRLDICLHRLNHSCFTVAIDRGIHARDTLTTAADRWRG
jgi:hypothetical protein